jgi:hypothetical protein
VLDSGPVGAPRRLRADPRSAERQGDVQHRRAVLRGQGRFRGHCPAESQTDVHFAGFARSDLDVSSQPTLTAFALRVSRQAAQPFGTGDLSL